MLLCVFALIPFALDAATNDLTSALQRGLFEEEANHNLEAAAQAYQTVSAQFDKDRKLAATAIFRLGEVYRKQGKTNEATAQYERIVREFSDQPTLVTLSRQNLAGIGSAAATTALSPVSAGGATAGLDGLQSQYALLKVQLEQARKETNDDVVAKLFNDEELRQAVANVAHAKLVLSSSKESNPPNPPAVKTWEAELRRAEQDLETFRKRLFDYQELRLKILQSAIQQARAGQAPGASASNDTGSTQLIEDEETEIRRLQAMIQNSPDLINAPRGEEGTPLYQAASKGQLQVAKFLLDHGAAINEQGRASGKAGWPPLIGAAHGGHKAMVELLLTRGADVNARDAQGLSALHQAARRGFKAVIEVLLDQKADVNARDQNEATTLHLAMIASPRAVIELLLARGAEVNAVTAKEFDSGKFGFVSGTPLHIAIRRGERPLIELLLESKADVNAPAKGSMYGGRTPLQEAVSSGGAEIVELLLKRGADPNAGVKNLPLVAAAMGKQIEIARALLQGGAKADLASKTSQSVTPGQVQPSFGGEFGPYTPLQIAVAQGDVGMAKLLFKFKADANAKGPWTTPAKPLVFYGLDNVEMLNAFLDGGADPDATDNAVPLIVAAADLDAARVEPLIAHKANVNARGSVRGIYDVTPLFLAAMKNDEKSVELLLNAKADVNARTTQSWPALHQAMWYSSKEVVEMLLAHGADVNAQNETGATPLHLAVKFGRAKMVESLLAHEADPNRRDNQGITPLDLAKSQPLPGIGAPISAGSPRAAEEPRASAQELANLLRQHGALDDLPAFDRIQVKRPASHFSKTIFSKATTDGQQFTLFELIAVQYQFLAAAPGGEDGKREVVRLLAGNDQRSEALSFPDLAHVRLRRPAPDGKSWQEQVMDVGALLRSEDCTKDVPLHWGDEVVIPETDHPLDARWDGFSRAELKSLNQCLTRSVTVIVKGQSTKITVGPKFEYLEEGPNAPWVVTKAPVWIQPVLRSSNLLLSSSDLSRVKVTRRDSATGHAREWILDCSKSDSAPAFWLRDGDVIEVPDKP